MAKQQGLSDAHIAGLVDRPAGLFDERELAALDLAEALWSNAGRAGSDANLIVRLRQHFSDAAIVELVWAIGQYIGLGKMIAFTGIERAE